MTLINYANIATWKLTKIVTKIILKTIKFQKYAKAFGLALPWGLNFKGSRAMSAVLKRNILAFTS